MLNLLTRGERNIQKDEDYEDSEFFDFENEKLQKLARKKPKEDDTILRRNMNEGI